jgi:hypothetical protein
MYDVSEVDYVVCLRLEEFFENKGWKTCDYKYEPEMIDLTEDRVAFEKYKNSLYLDNTKTYTHHSIRKKKEDPEDLLMKGILEELNKNTPGNVIKQNLKATGIVDN